jgi:1,4-dihydroxy-6-naphthoate synthase
MSHVTERFTLRVGHSPDPDDAFMFYGLAKGLVRGDQFEIEHVVEDIESLNQRALKGDLEVTAISAHAYPYVADKYYVMRCGASMGLGYGPVLVTKNGGKLDDFRQKRIAVPGPLTTAFLILQLYLPEFEALQMPFDQIIQRVMDGEVDAGLLIHEGQLTHPEYGLQCVADFGRIWEDETGLPLPLGLDVVRKDLGHDLARGITGALAESIALALGTKEDDAVEYSLQFGRGIDRETGRKFVKMYVNELTVDMGEVGQKALELLLNRGAERGLVPKVQEWEFV